MRRMATGCLGAFLCVAVFLSGCAHSGVTSGQSTPETPTVSASAVPSAMAGFRDDGPVMGDYLTFTRPQGLLDGCRAGPIGSAEVFIRPETAFREDSMVPFEWQGAGGVMEYGSETTIGGSAVTVDDSGITMVRLLWPEAQLISAIEPVPGAAANGSIAEMAVYSEKMWFAFFAEKDGAKAFALFLNEKYYGKADIVKLAQSVHFVSGAFAAHDPNLQYSQEYIVNSGNIKGGVDIQWFLSRSPDFDIGANRYGWAVFKHPDAAYARLLKEYEAGISLVQREFNLPPLTQRAYLIYKALGWQVTTGTKEEFRQANFLSDFFDIYEDSDHAPW